MGRPKHHQMTISELRELVVDNFAGGGGASTGIALAIGRSPDIAINHDPAAIAMHTANHPETLHLCESVWEVDPRKVTQGQPVGLAWFSPDCTHFSKAKGGKPVSKKIRGLAWVAIRWATQVRPRVIMLENVEEFVTWGPLIKGPDGEMYPDPQRKSQTFQAFVSKLRKLGYHVEWRELRACDYGAPTIRKRFFLVARRDGRPIVWPEPTHGDPQSEAVKSGKLLPWRTAAEIIDWSLPCPSIFGRKRPLAENTLKRIARGVQRFVIDNPKPFVIRLNYPSSSQRERMADEPIQTMTAKNDLALINPFIVKPNHTTTKGVYDCFRGHSGEQPLGTITASPGFALVAAFLAQYHSETANHEARGQMMDRPILTVDTSNRYALVTSHMVKMYGTTTGHKTDEPLHTVTSGGFKFGEVRTVLQHHPDSIPEPEPRQATCDLEDDGCSCADEPDEAEPEMDDTEPVEPPTGTTRVDEVRAFLLKYYGTNVGQRADEPLHTVTTKHRLGLVTVHGQDYQIVDIGMRMLEPHELFAAQGFPPDYIIDRDCDGNRYSKATQVARCGNAVPPPFPKALVEANLPEMCSPSRSTEVSA